MEQLRHGTSDVGSNSIPAVTILGYFPLPARRPHGEAKPGTAVDAIAGQTPPIADISVTDSNMLRSPFRLLNSARVMRP
jgi:hypothetical protein